MSFSLMAWASKTKTQNAGQKLVLLMLASHSNGHTGQCNPSHKLLAEECSMPISTLKLRIKELEALGFIKIIPKSLEGVSLPNQYVLLSSEVSICGGVGQELTDGGLRVDPGVGQQPATKQEYKTVIETNTPEGVSEQVFKDYKKLRERLKAPVTQTSIALLKTKAIKGGYTLEQAMLYCIENSWRGFDPSWVKSKTEVKHSWEH